MNGSESERTLDEDFMKKDISPEETDKMAQQLAEDFLTKLRRAAADLESIDPQVRKNTKGKLDLAISGEGFGSLKKDAQNRVFEAAEKKILAETGIAPEAIKNAVDQTEQSGQAWITTKWDGIYYQLRNNDANTFSINEFSPGNKPTNLIDRHGSTTKN